eukprot:TRINITY_DN4541_c0_g1_i5.p1 TRINITY_DN4541_c0_g1~~TRINITY_DN4541_c0_g1_i5.p1  ORF type:complete len:263 (-),score=37.06 TRINITY_DN4541_c0_g1_i5:381-1169(-)
MLPTLPIELIIEIVQFLNVRDIARCELVNRDWKGACHEVWLLLAQKHGIPRESPIATIKLALAMSVDEPRSFTFGRWIVTTYPDSSISIQHSKLTLEICYCGLRQGLTASTEIYIRTKPDTIRLKQFMAFSCHSRVFPAARSYRPRISRALIDTFRPPLGFSCEIAGNVKFTTSDMFANALLAGEFVFQVRGVLPLCVYPNKDYLLFPGARTGCVKLFETDDAAAVLAPWLRARRTPAQGSDATVDEMDEWDPVYYDNDDDG